MCRSPVARKFIDCCEVSPISSLVSGKSPHVFSKVPRLPVAIRGLVTIVGHWEIKLPVFDRNVALNRNFAGAVLLIPPL